MSYASGGLIQATDYNGLAQTNSANVAWVMGVGRGQFGYGQDTSVISTVSSGGTVTATQWAGLLWLINRGLGHQGGTQIAAGNLNAQAGQTITYFSNVATAVTTINTNAALFGSQGGTTTGATFSPNFTVANTTAAQTWNFTRTITWASADQARYFFNAGGQINFVTTSVTNGDASARSADWVTLIGTYLVNISAIRGTTNGGKSGTGGTVNVNNTAVGYWNAGGSTTFGTGTVLANIATASVPYANDTVNVKIRTSGVAGTNADVGTTLYLDFSVFAAAQATLPVPPTNTPGTGTTTTFTTIGDSLNVTWNHRIDVVVPESTYLLTTSWGVPTIT